MKPNRWEWFERECHRCGKRYYHTADWAYTLLLNGRKRSFCSWKCLREEEKEYAEAKEQRRLERKRLRELRKAEREIGK